MKLNLEVGLGPGHIVLDRDLAPPPQRGTVPPFSAHVCFGQTAGWNWIKMSLGKIYTEVGLGPGDNVLDGDLAPPPKKRRGDSSHHISAPVLWPNGWMDQDVT